MGKSRNIQTNNHSVFEIYYHLVLVIKYRRKVIDNDISKRLLEIFDYIAPNYHICIKEWNHDKDHVHILFTARPDTDLVKFINAYKSASSRIIKQEFPAIRTKLWKEFFWNSSYCLITTGGVTTEIIRKYILSKENKWQTKQLNTGYILQVNNAFYLPKPLAVAGRFIT